MNEQSQGVKWRETAVYKSASELASKTGLIANFLVCVMAIGMTLTLFTLAGGLANQWDWIYGLAAVAIGVVTGSLLGTTLRLTVKSRRALKQCHAALKDPVALKELRAVIDGNRGSGHLVPQEQAKNLLALYDGTLLEWDELRSATAFLTRMDEAREVEQRWRGPIARA